MDERKDRSRPTAKQFPSSAAATHVIRAGRAVAAYALFAYTRRDALLLLPPPKSPQQLREVCTSVSRVSCVDAGANCRMWQYGIRMGMVEV